MKIEHDKMKNEKRGVVVMLTTVSGVSISSTIAVSCTRLSGAGLGAVVGAVVGAAVALLLHFGDFVPLS